MACRELFMSRVDDGLENRQLSPELVAGGGPVGVATGRGHVTIDLTVPPTWLQEEHTHKYTRRSSAVPARTQETLISHSSVIRFFGARTAKGPEEEEIRTRGRERKKSCGWAGRERRREGGRRRDSLDHRTAPHAFISVTRL